MHAYLGSWHDLQLPIKDFLYAFTHLTDNVVWSIEGETVVKYQANISSEFIHGHVARVLGVGVGFRRVRSIEFALNGGKVHGVFDDGGIMGDVEGDRVDRL
jgi:hypothetical protein